MVHGTGGEATLLFAFIAGLASFLSPCVLPVIPAYLAHLAGTTLDTEIDRFTFFRSALFFVIGFSLVFAGLGVALNSVLEQVAGTVLVWLSRVAGVVIIVFGLHLAGLIRFTALEKEYSLPVPDRLAGLPATSLVFGAAFAVGWTPCVGPILGSIFTLAAASPGSAFTLLLSYGLGLGVPFLLIGLFPFKATEFIKTHTAQFRVVQQVFGYILVLLGIMVFTMNLDLVANLELLNQVVLG